MDYMDTDPKIFCGVPLSLKETIGRLYFARIHVVYIFRLTLIALIIYTAIRMVVSMYSFAVIRFVCGINRNAVLLHIQQSGLILIFKTELKVSNSSYGYAQIGFKSKGVRVLAYTGAVKPILFSSEDLVSQY